MAPSHGFGCSPWSWRANPAPPPPKASAPRAGRSGGRAWRRARSGDREDTQRGHKDTATTPARGTWGGSSAPRRGKTEVHGDKVGSSTSLGRQRLVPGTLADTGRCWSHRVPILGSAGEGQQAPRADNIAAFDSKASESLPRRGSIWLPGSAGGVSSLLSKGGSEGWDGMGHSSLQIWCHPLQQENCSSPLTISIFKSARSAGFLIKLK